MRPCGHSNSEPEFFFIGFFFHLARSVRIRDAEADSQTDENEEHCDRDHDVDPEGVK